MAIVLIIITLIVGTALVPLGAQIEQRQRAETQRTLDEIKEALIGYALSQGKLPCPSAVVSTIPNGIATASCSSIATGYIPWDTLGVNNKDAWGNLIRYAVDAQFTITTTAFGLGTTGSIAIKTHNADGTTPTISSTIPAVVLSLGRNGYGAMSADGIPQSTPATFATNNPDEYQNQKDNSNFFFSHTPAPQGTAASKGGEFDDMVVWISPNILFNRMVAAGVLPR
jgi:type II secretory pathway pseudopilin PulG